MKSFVVSLFVATNQAVHLKDAPQPLVLGQNVDKLSLAASKNQITAMDLVGEIKYQTIKGLSVVQRDKKKAKLRLSKIIGAL